MKTAGKVSAFVAFVLLSTAPSYAINLVLDYTHDTFFATHATANAALQAAAADISAAITTSLNATVDTNTANVNGSTATFDFNLSYTQPTLSGTQTLSSAVMPANQVKIYVGTRNLTGNTLGTGGPGGAGYNVNVSYFNVPDLTAAVNQAAAAGQTNMLRGGGPIIGNLSGNLSGGFGSIPISIDYGSTVGNLWFDVDSDNNGVMDSDPTLNNYWHYDHTTAVAAGKNDFYSVAVHEILHSLGIASGVKSWQNYASGSNWNGPAVIALAGSGTGMIQSGGGHITEGKMSNRVSDGGAQEAVMDPTLTTGTRKKLTNLDLAFLRDIGWTTVAYNTGAHAGDFDADGDVDGADFVAWQTNFPKASGATLAQGDADADGDVDGADFVVWQTNFPFTPGPGAAPVPEPATWTLVMLALGGLAIRARRRI
jgi:hypothetical protein